MSPWTFLKIGTTSCPLIFCILMVNRLSSVFAGAAFGCRSLHFLKPIGGLALQDHVIKEINLTTEMELNGDCRHQCLQESSCVSVNIGLSKNDSMRICQLSDSDHTQHPDDLKPKKDFLYWATTNPCSSNPCLHGATCFSGFTDKRYVCLCQAGYTGENCEKDIDECANHANDCHVHALCTNTDGSYTCTCKCAYRGDGKNCTVSSALPKSCSDLKKLDPNAKIGPCLIDPDGDGGLSAFNVTCDMSDKDGVGVTVISHDSENRTLVDGYEETGSYSRDIHYKGANISQLVNLIDISQHCEQFIKYECLGSNLKDGFWVSRDSVAMTYWSGATPESHMCGCGITNTCPQPGNPADYSVHCNCHMNDNVWREDSGVLTNRTHLPVKQLKFGDTGVSHLGDDLHGNNEKGYHTLGKFKCYGIA